MNKPAKPLAPKITMRDPVKLIPDERNARTHSDEQIAQLRASMDEFGFTNPILLRDEHGNIGAGHGRREAALLEPPIAFVPCIVIGGLSDAQWRALAIADNQLALNAGWDLDILAGELAALEEDGFDISILGFDDDFLAGLFDEPGPARSFSGSIPEEALEHAWRLWAGELAAQIRACAKIGSGRQGVTPGFALRLFLEALHNGEEYPRFAQAAFHPELYAIPGSAKSLLEGLDAVAEGTISVKSLAFVCGDRMSLSSFFCNSLAFSSARLPMDFPASLARALIDEFAPGGAVIDPCHGWGGRLVGFLLSTATSYAGTDPSPATNRGVKALRELFLPYVDGKEASLDALPMEEWEPQAREGGYDFALTSPPYFDTEKYMGGKQSRLAHSSYEDWRDGFYLQLIARVFGWLRPGGVFALQIGSQSYPLLEDGKALAMKAGFAVEAVRATDMDNPQWGTSDEDGEALLILRKPLDLATS